MASGYRHLPPHLRPASDTARPGMFVAGLVLIALSYLPPIGAKFGWSGMAELWSTAGTRRWAFIAPLLFGCYSVVRHRQAVRIPALVAALIAIGAIVGFATLAA